MTFLVNKTAKNKPMLVFRTVVVNANINELLRDFRKISFVNNVTKFLIPLNCGV
jgi:hypothetical protein